MMQLEFKYIKNADNNIRTANAYNLYHSNCTGSLRTKYETDNKEVLPMTLEDFMDLVNKKKAENEKVIATQRFALGMGIAAIAAVAIGILFATKSGKAARDTMSKKVVDTVETLKDQIQENAENVKNSEVHAAQKMSDAVKNLDGKAEDVKNDIQDGYREIAGHIQKTAGSISKDFNKSAK